MIFHVHAGGRERRGAVSYGMGYKRWPECIKEKRGVFRKCIGVQCRWIYRQYCQSQT
jgi:hypothetical protein